MSDDMKPREPNCECNVEEGDSSCPVHGDCAWCGGLSPGCCKDARIAPLEADLARVTKERDRLLKLFDDAGQGEHNVLALVDYYQDQALTAGRERDALKAGKWAGPRKEMTLGGRPWVRRYAPHGQIAMGCAVHHLARCEAELVAAGWFLAEEGGE